MCDYCWRWAGGETYLLNLSFDPKLKFYFFQFSFFSAGIQCVVYSVFGSFRNEGKTNGKGLTKRMCTYSVEQVILSVCWVYVCEAALEDNCWNKELETEREEQNGWAWWALRDENDEIFLCWNCLQMCSGSLYGIRIFVYECHCSSFITFSFTASVPTPTINDDNNDGCQMYC